MQNEHDTSPAVSDDPRKRIEDLEDRLQKVCGLESEIERLKAGIDESARYGAMGSFARGIVHEINNVLGIMMALVERGLTVNPPGAPGNANYSRLNDAVKRATDLVRQIPASYRKSDARSPVEIGLIVKGASRFLEGSLPINVSLNMDVPADSGAVMTDPAEVHRILVYLASVASQALDRTGGELSISLGRIGLENGPSTHRLSAVCRRERQSPEAPDLALFADPDYNRFIGFLSDIMAQQAGAFKAFMEEGKLVFFMDFPGLEEDRSKEKSEAPKEAARGSERLLFVEDEKVLAELWADVLSDMGYEVTVAHSGREALDIFTADPLGFDCVLTDRTMPIMPGERLARAISKIRPEIPIIMCTGHSGLMTPEMLAQNHLKACLQKPLGFKEVAETLRRVIDESKRAS